ncbi:hypothetical protein HYFRA_00001452 [Hymenoscyphus fraxineus]|uniref:Uncharacterized protein n=1 Tax=Hymenoscyphus fraxineus TaxID=746836 RepID=A0A9N9L6Q5_9HELO|nr:hypothetical protein HYFRA_00001452 [Hymenoscyphus fraxineus]
MKLISLILIAGIGVHACERNRQFHNQHTHFKREDVNATFPPILDANEQILVDSIDSTSISTWSYYFTHGRVVAGENKTMAEWTAEQWAKYGFKTRLDEYYVYLNYPVEQSLELTYPNGSTFKATFKEDVLDEDETTSYPNRVPAFHGYSFSGNASGEYVYVGRGQKEDFEQLKSLGIDLKGKIALAKYGGPFRGIKVKNAQNNGMVGAIVFTDPVDDGNVTEAKGVLAYPNGPARNPTSIQRGSVQFISEYPGDPTTLGYPSKEDSPRLTPTNLAHIPSLPLSWIEAQPILQALDGCGTDGESVGRENWIGAIPNVNYSTGPAPGVTLSMNNVMEDKITPIWNVIGIINGTNEDEVVIVGNHRDAWVVGGAADPHSGSAIVVELAKAFGSLLKTGWKPKRTIILASWDAEEYGLVGSTEWVEEYVPWLKERAIAYLNIDVGISGPIPDFSATPDLYKITTSIGKKVVWPTTENRTLYDVTSQYFGEQPFGVLGSGSDYTAFVHSGIASIDTGSTRGPDAPIYHYHSNFDSYHWMSTFADPGFKFHKAMGQFLTLYLYHMVNDDSVPLDPANYGPEMRGYLEGLQSDLKSINSTLDLTAIDDAISAFEESAKQFNNLRDMATSLNHSKVLTELNHKARDFSRGFLNEEGSAGRPFFKNLIFAPGTDTGYAPVIFPGVSEAVDAGDFALAAEFVKKTAVAILAASDILRPGLVGRGLGGVPILE